jgi:hypothetical protein
VIATAAPWESVVAALVTAGVAAGVAVWQGSKTRSTNSADHADVKDQLLGLHSKVDRVGETLEQHLKDHHE